MSSAARKTAYRCLLRCDEGAYSNLTLRQELEALSDVRDTAFCTSLALGTLSRLETIDMLLTPHLKKKVSALDKEVRTILRMGVYQLVWMDSVPDRAAINESVEMCKEASKKSAAGLVNAVLRKIAGTTWDDICNKTKGNRYLNIRYSVCRPLFEAIKADYPDSFEEILKSTFIPAQTFLRVNKLRLEPEKAAELISKRGAEVSICEPAGCLRYKGSLSLVADLLEDGTLRVQSRAAQYAASFAKAAPGTRVLDMCAAPGGKTLSMAQDMCNRGTVVAEDISGTRLSLIEKQAKREGITIVKTVEGDAGSFISDELFDTVLCDVPCSGFGEISAKPELRYKDPAVSKDLPALQYDILCAGARSLKKGGRLVYSTCTILKRENEEIINRFLAQRNDMVLERMQCFLPCEESSEGFFAAAMVKVE